jgi:hypothetical protein
MTLAKTNEFMSIVMTLAKTNEFMSIVMTLAKPRIERLLVSLILLWIG